MSSLHTTLDWIILLDKMSHMYHNDRFRAESKEIMSTEG
jgi:hypothetical protein